jgi:DNA-binding NtrC family response regulator
MTKGNSKRILVVEDEEPLQEMYQEMFGRSGHVVEVAENGRIGFRKAATFDYDLIICDLHMPEWNGVDAIKSILLVKPNCKFIVVSGYADKKIADELYDIPAILKVLAKPADIHQLRSCLDLV